MLVLLHIYLEHIHDHSHLMLHVGACRWGVGELLITKKCPTSG